MSELSKAYNPQDHEAGIKEAWNQSGFCNPDNLVLSENAPTFTIVLPPPNVTDRLHLGHASMLAIQDLLVRFHRMNGYRTLWLPGTDHASIATQNVVERAILKNEGKTRHEIGREEFVRRTIEFALETQATIIGQIKDFGASLDWSRLAFTLDEQRQKAVQKMFIDMYEAGAIYRGERIVNWCPRCQSTLADDEMEYKTEKTTLYTFKYWKDFPIAISTTRPETKLGDTAVAVNPKDERYKQYIGQEFSGDFCGQPLTIKIIADREVEMEFGTGALGVTPAHSAIDWRMAEQNDLPIVKVIDEQGNIREGFGVYSGLNVEAVRATVVESLRQNGLIEKEEEIEHNVSTCYRCDTVIEPLPSKQWFIAVDKPLERLGGKSLKQAAREASENLEIIFVPDRFKKRFEDWMTNLRDWCISRQIWFGHSIPVWYRNDEIIVALQKPEGEGWKQDEDTLDTWFSAGMWSFSTLGWPDTFKDGVKSGDLAAFHPTTVMETGYDIITLWVSRMIMMSLFAVGEIPFTNVYLHGMVLDKDGKKMSKTKGNGIDPVVVGKEYGTDAVRLALLLGNTPGVDVRLSEEKIASFRNFVNKLWNVSRFIMSREESEAEGELSLADTWIASRLAHVIPAVETKIKAFDFSGAGEILRDFTLDDVADWYIEASKFNRSRTSDALARRLLENIVKLWHPYMPFVTEVIWKELCPEDGLLFISNWPGAATDEVNEAAEQEFELIRAVIGAIRNVRSEHRIEPARKLTATVFAGSQSAVLERSRVLLMSLRTGIETLTIAEKGTAPVGALYATVQGIDIYLEAPLDAEAERTRLEKEIAYVTAGLKAVEVKLANVEFKEKAPAQLVAAEEKKLNDYRETLLKLQTQLSALA